MAHATYDITIVAANAAEWIDVKAKVDQTVADATASLTSISRTFDENLLTATLHAVDDGAI